MRPAIVLFHSFFVFATPFCFILCHSLSLRYEGTGEPPGQLLNKIILPDGSPRYKQVRSAVRENALWSAVTLSTRGLERDTLSPPNLKVIIKQALLQVFETDGNGWYALALRRMRCAASALEMMRR